MNKEEFLNRLDNYDKEKDEKELLDYIREKVVNKLDSIGNFKFGNEYFNIVSNSNVTITIGKLFGYNYSINFRYNDKKYILRFPIISFKEILEIYPEYEKDTVENLKKRNGIDIREYGLTCYNKEKESLEDIFVTDNFDDFIENVYKYIK